MSAAIAPKALSYDSTLRFFLETLDPKQIVELEDSMQPHAESAAGFLGVGESLKSVFELDEEVIKASKITYVQIADRLDGLVDKLLELHQINPFVHVTKKIALIDDDFYVKMISLYRGYQSCPFQRFSHSECDISRSCYNIYIEHVHTGEFFHFGGLSSHLLHKHEFCEGIKSPYRFPLEKALKVLSLKPETSYELPKFDEKIWTLVFSSTQNEQELHKVLDVLLGKALEIRSSKDGKFHVILSNYDLNKSKMSEDSLFLYGVSRPHFHFDIDLKFEDIKPLNLDDFTFMYRCHYVQMYQIRHIKSAVLGKTDHLLDESCPEYARINESFLMKD